MEDFFKYLNPSEKDKNWGLYLNVAGKSTTKPHTVYPSREHPSGYYFTWKKGRILQEYQLVYITEGAGEFKSEQEAIRFQEGTMLLLRPGERHRYRPDPQTGWVENYIGFNGNLARHFYAKAGFLESRTVFDCGIQESFLDIYYSIATLVKDERPGFQQIASGLIINLIGKMVAHEKQGPFSGKPIETIIRKSLLEMRENVTHHIDLQEIANRHNVGYANFRKMFKKYTGLAPRQYHLNLKLMHAKQLILTSDKSIKEISQELQFESIHYFSRFFKKKMGYSPSELRKTAV